MQMRTTRRGNLFGNLLTFFKLKTDEKKKFPFQIKAIGTILYLYVMDK